MSKAISGFIFFIMLISQNFLYANYQSDNDLFTIKGQSSVTDTLFIQVLNCRFGENYFARNGFPKCRLNDNTRKFVENRKIPTKEFVDQKISGLTSVDTATNKKLDNVNTTLTTRMDNLSAQLFDLVDKKLEGHVTNQINEKAKTLVSKSINSNEVKSIIRTIVKEELESTINIQIQNILKKHLEKE